MTYALTNGNVHHLHIFFQESMNKRRSQNTSLERKSSFLSDGTFESISESETSTAPSSLQTIVRAPYANSISQYNGFSEYESSPESPTPVKRQDTSNKILPSEETSESEAGFSSANNLRKVSEQLLSNGRTRSSLSGPSLSRQPQNSTRPNSLALVSPVTNGVSKIPGPASIGQSSSGSSSGSRPSSQLSNIYPHASPRPGSQLGFSSGTQQTQSRLSQLATSTPGRESRPNSFAGPPNTLGLPQQPTGHNISGLPTPTLGQKNGTSIPHFKQSSSPHMFNSSHASTPSKIPSKLHSISPEDDLAYGESNGLLSTISQAAISDDESPPVTHKPNPPKFNTAALSKPSVKSPSVLPNYENVQNQIHSTGTQSGIPRPLTSPSPVMMTQGQYRAAASQARVATIPDDSNTYIPMGVKKASGSNISVMTQKTPLATSSPSRIPTYMPSLS